MEPDKIGRAMIIIGGIMMLISFYTFMQNQDLIHDGMNWKAYKSFEDNCIKQNARTVMSCEYTYFPNYSKMSNYSNLSNSNISYRIGISGDGNG